VNSNGIRSSLEPLDIVEDRYDDGLTAYAGLPVAIEAWYAFGLDKVCKDQLKLRVRQKGLSDSQWAEVLTVLILAGGRSVEDLDALKMDAGLCRMWPLLRRASARSALNYLHRFDDPGSGKSRQGRARIRRESQGLRGLGRVNEHLIGELQRRVPQREATVDVDASIHESKKREALWTYDGVRGYQPVIAYWVQQGVIVGDEFRDGNVPAGMGNEEFLRRVFAGLPDGIQVRRVRGDTALYEQRALRMLEREGIEFAISADVSEQLREQMLAIQPQQWRRYWKIGRQGERIDTGKEWAEVAFVPEERGARRNDKPFRYVGIRIRRRQADLFEGAYEHFAVVTNRWEMEGSELLNWQRGRCGTVEWAHDVLKNDLGARTFPSNRFGANAAWYRLNVLAFNLKAALTRVALPKYAHVRPHTLRVRLFHLAGRVVCHSRKLSMVMSRGSARGRVDVLQWAQGVARTCH